MPLGSGRARRRSLAAHRLALTAVRPARGTATRSGRLRIAILLLSADDRSGVVPATLNVAAHLARRHDVRVVSVLGRRRQPFFALPEGVRRVTLDYRRGDPSRPPAQLVHALLRRTRGRLIHPSDRRAGGTTGWTDLMLIRGLRRLDADLVISTRFSLSILAARLGGPGSTLVIGQEHMHLAGKPPQRLEAIRQAYPELDALAVLTEDDRRDYERLLRATTRVVRIPNAVRALGGPPSPLSHPVVLGAGRLARQKGFPRLIRAFARVSERAPGWSVRICGQGSARRELRELAERRGVGDRVALPGVVKDMAGEMERASVFALSSRSEGYPLVLIEAMSKGLPAVAFDVPTGPADMVVDGETGFLIPDGDIQAFADALLELMRDEDKRQRFGAAAAERARSFTPERVGPLWDALIGELLVGAGYA
jgi:glycosyltransferase involved in cell wall biosynthesis